jgi:hypothetical protein
MGSPHGAVVLSMTPLLAAAPKESSRHAFSKRQNGKLRDAGPIK